MKDPDIRTFGEVIGQKFSSSEVKLVLSGIADEDADAFLEWAKENFQAITHDDRITPSEEVELEWA